jgi:hypothetical protein
LTPSDEGHFDILNRMFGAYWCWYWIEIGTYILVPHILWSRKIENSPGIRIFISIWIFIVVNLERFLIFVISFNRDFIPSSWSINEYGLTGNLFLDSISYVSIYCGIVGIVYFLKRLVK